MAEENRYFPKIALTLLALVAGLILISPAYWAAQLAYIVNKEEPSATPGESEGEKITPNMLIIPSLGISAPIQYVEQTDEESFQSALASGVVHYPGTAEIGQYGNPYIFGHSSDYVWAKGEYKTVFALLPRIKEGDEIIASDKEGNKFVYTVTDIKIASPKDKHYIDTKTTDEKFLTVQTSWPVGTALKRFLAIAKLQES